MRLGAERIGKACFFFTAGDGLAGFWGVRLHVHTMQGKGKGLGRWKYEKAGRKMLSWLPLLGPLAYMPCWD